MDRIFDKGLFPAHFVSPAPNQALNIGPRIRWFVRVQPTVRGRLAGCVRRSIPTQPFVEFALDVFRELHPKGA